MAQCTAIKQGGERCKGTAIDTAGYCYAHHPEHAGDRTRAARKGGKRGGRGRPMSELAALKSETAEIRRKLLEGELPSNLAAVANQLLGTEVRIVSETLKAKEQEEFEARLEELEEAHARQSQRKDRYYGS
jgi:hypothetical protein